MKNTQNPPKLTYFQQITSELWNSLDLFYFSLCVSPTNYTLTIQLFSFVLVFFQPNVVNNSAGTHKFFSTFKIQNDKIEDEKYLLDTQIKRNATKN